MNIFFSEINFHNIKNWSSEDLLGKDDTIAKKKNSFTMRRNKKIKVAL